MKMSKKTATGAIVSFATAALIASSTAAFSAGTLNVTNWAEYIAEDTIANFAKEYDIKVIYDTYDSVEAIDAKLLAGSSGYDVVSHAGSSAGRLIPAGIL